MSPNSTTSSPLVTTPPESKLTGGNVSDLNEPPSPPMSDASAPMPKQTPAKTPSSTLQRKTRLPSLDHSVTPKPRAKSTSTVRAGGPRMPGAGTSTRTPANNRSTNSRTVSHKLPASNSLTHIRSLTEKMQRLEARVQSVRSKLPGPTNTPPRASPRSAAKEAGGVPSTVTIRSRKRTTGSTASSLAGDDATPTNFRSSTTSRQGHVPRLSTSGVSRLSFGPLPNRAPDADNSRPSSRASMSSYARPSSRTDMVPPPRPMSRTSLSGSRTPLSRPKSSLSLHGHSSSMSRIDMEEEQEMPVRTPSRRGTYSKQELDSGITGIPMPNSSIPTPSSRRQSGGRRTSTGVARDATVTGRPSTSGGRKLSDLGETY